MSNIIGVYPGTFDPVTYGHLDIIERASKLVDKLVIGVAQHCGVKTPLFSVTERQELLKKEVEKLNLPNNKIEVKVVEGLLLNFAKAEGAKIIFRGLRAVSDFDYEFKMSAMNLRMDKNIETVFLMASEKQQFISGVFVKEIWRLGGDISSFVPQEVMVALDKKR